MTLTPYRWMHVVQAGAASAWKADAEARWPDVTVIVRPRR